MKNYIMPHTEAQIISVGQLMLPGSVPSIEKGGNLNGQDINPRGLYVG